MTDKVQKIREEVERLQNELIQEKEKGYGLDADDACILELQNVLTYIDSLQEEPVSEDLEEAAIMHYKDVMEYEVKTGLKPAYMTSFKAGANWQKEKDEEEKVLTYKHGFEDCKEQMMKGAIDAQCFGFQGAALFSFRLPADNYLVGSEVKVIVIEEE